MAPQETDEKVIENPRPPSQYYPKDPEECVNASLVATMYFVNETNKHDFKGKHDVFSTELSRGGAFLDTIRVNTEFRSSETAFLQFLFRKKLLHHSKFATFQEG